MLAVNLDSLMIVLDIYLNLFKDRIRKMVKARVLMNYNGSGGRKCI